MSRIEKTKTPGKLGREEQAGPAVTPLQFSSIYEDGFTTVSHARPPPKISSKASNYNAGKRSPPSAAAVKRGQVYEHIYSKAPSGYKQSCLPVDERDPVLVEKELNKGIKLPKGSFKPGMIIRAALHESSFSGTSVATDATDADIYLTESKFGTIHTKYRKFIVLTLLATHYLAVPIYTHNGQGLEGKPHPEERSEEHTS